MQSSGGAQCKGAAQVRPAIRGAEGRLLRRWPNTPAEIGPEGPLPCLAQRSGDFLRLVEAAFGLAAPVQWHRDHRVRCFGEAGHTERQQLAEAPGYRHLSAELGCRDQAVDRVFICKGRQRHAETPLRRQWLLAAGIEPGQVGEAALTARAGKAARPAEQAARWKQGVQHLVNP